MIDQLLASSQFGEHWGRYWLDVVRYADSFGSVKNWVFPLAWKYRNYVLDSFAEDKPYDQFLREQVAGDLLAQSPEQDGKQARIATGFFTLGCRNLNDMDVEHHRAEEVGEQIDAFGQAMLGLTLACARCHDHKTAPISLSDYYALAGVFYNTQPLAGFGRFAPGIRARRRADLLLSLASNPQDAGDWLRDARMLTELLEVIDDQMIELANRRRELEDADPFDEKAHKSLSERIGKKNELFYQANKHLRDANELAMGVRDAEQCQDMCIHEGGDPHNLGERVPRTFLPQLAEHVSAELATLATSPIPAGASGRRRLAKWLTHPDHPLVARVMVNRVWAQLFGRGLVRTVDNLGPSGDPPTHPKLLDHLAVEFVETGWSIKQLIRTIVLSRTYRQSTVSDAANIATDPDNVYLWRMTPRRLDVEAIRDAMLTVSGKLDPSRPEGPLFPPELFSVDDWKEGADKFLSQPYRTVYLPVFRRALPDMYRTLDFAPPEQVCGRRDVTTVPTQALLFMNNPLVKEYAASAAERVLAESHDDVRRVEPAFLATVSRSPSADEVRATTDYVGNALAAGQTEISAWTDVYHAQFGCAEFLYRN